MKEERREERERERERYVGVGVGVGWKNGDLIILDGNKDSPINGSTELECYYFLSISHHFLLKMS